jgi:Ribosome biogenesis protein Nop16
MTPTANLTKLGLVALPNQRNAPETSNSNGSNVFNESGKPYDSSSSAIVELFDVPDSDGLTHRRRGTRLFPMDIDDEKYVVKCMGKYGDDYTRMFRDIKINIMQHTEEKLRKLCTRYLLLTPEQRRVEVPEKVQNVINQHAPETCD